LFSDGERTFEDEASRADEAAFFTLGGAVGSSIVFYIEMPTQSINHGTINSVTNDNFFRII